MATSPIILDTTEAQAAYCKRLRSEAGLTQQELAEALGYKHAQAISNAENAANGSRTGVRLAIIRHLRPKAKAREALVVEE